MQRRLSITPKFSTVASPPDMRRPPSTEVPPMPQEAAKKKTAVVKPTVKYVRKMRKPDVRSIHKLALNTQKDKNRDVKPPGGRPSLVPNATAKREVEKRMAAVHKANEKLREKSEKLAKDLASLKEEENAIEQERDRLQQLWMIAREETEGERDSRHEMEKVVQRMKTAHEKSITQLQQRMRMLLLAAKTQRIASTQTELVYVGGPFEEREVQTVEELTREKAAVQLRQNDHMLTRMVEALEKEKLNAQSDLKYSIVQLEQRMKEEKDTELRRLREEKLRQLDEISALHSEELKTLEDELFEQGERAKDQLAKLQEELATTEAERDQLRVDLEVERGERERAEEEAARNRRDKDRIERDHVKLKARSDAVKRDAAQMERMKREVAKYREINEILLSEFAKMEEERDALADAVEKGVTRMEGVNGRRGEGLRERLDRLHERVG